MIKKGIVLAGGMGTRMSPITKAVNKQLLPIYDKPMIFYPLSILMLAKIRDILIIINKGQLEYFKKILPDGKNIGLNISYEEQNFPAGIPDAFRIGEKFIKKDNVALILGDNFYYGQHLSEILEKFSKLSIGANVLLHRVTNPSLYGVAKIDKKNRIILIKEKPKKFISDLAITGLYFFDNRVVEYSKELKPSKRGELEITDLLNKYLKDGNLKNNILGRGGAWLDTGSIDSFYNTINFVSAVQSQQGFKIACIEEIAYTFKWIKKKEIKNSIKFYGKCEYSDYLLKLIS
jgi:glucose-1-phosphate thymidylyltransferase